MAYVEFEPRRNRLIKKQSKKAIKKSVTAGRIRAKEPPQRELSEYSGFDLGFIQPSEQSYMLVRSGKVDPITKEAQTGEFIRNRSLTPQIVGDMGDKIRMRIREFSGNRFYEKHKKIKNLGSRSAFSEEDLRKLQKMYSLAVLQTGELIPSEDEQRTIFNHCCAALKQNRPLLVSFKVPDFFYPWNMLVVKKYPTHNFTPENFDFCDFASCFLGFYAMCVNIPASEGVSSIPYKHRSNQKFSLFANQKMYFVSRAETRYIEHLGRKNYFDLSKVSEFDLEANGKITQMEAKLARLLNKSASHIYHFACHSADRDGDKILDLGWSQPIGINELSTEKFSLSSNSLVFLNSCDSNYQSAADFMDIGKPFTPKNDSNGILIGTECEIGDAPSAQFANAFYSNLVTKRLSLADSFIAARRSMVDRGSFVGFSYSVSGNPFIEF